MNYNELIKYYETFDKNDLAEAARTLFFKIAKRIGELTNDEDFGVKFAVTVIANAISQDGQLGTSEWALFQYILQEECDQEDVLNFLAQYSDDALVTEIKKFASADKDLGHDIVQLVLATTSIDGEVSPEEHHLIKYLLDL